MKDVLGLTFISAGAAMIVAATVLYHRLLKINRERTYSALKLNPPMYRAALIMLYFFIGGFAVGAYDVLRRDVEPIYRFVIVVFFFGALFILMAIYVQYNMNEKLYQKTVETMRAFINAVELKDPYTRGHSQHVADITALFYDKLPSAYKETVNKAMLVDAALLHDVGKIGIRENILNKRGALTEEEWAVIKKHPMDSKLVLANTCYSELGDWVLYHHERMDGNGYYGLEKDSIPVESRIIAIADNYGALCTDRVYRPRKDHASAIEIMMHSAGSQLDEDLMAIFLTIRPDDLAKALKV